MKNSEFQVLVPKSVARVIKRFPIKARKALYEAIEGLSNNPRPRGSIKLKVKDLGEYRIRVRGYRIRYDIDYENQIVSILAVKPRGEAYKV